MRYRSALVPQTRTWTGTSCRCDCFRSGSSSGRLTVPVGRKEQQLLITFIITCIRFNGSSAWRGTDVIKVDKLWRFSHDEKWPIINRVGWAKGGKMECLIAPRRSSLVLENGERLTRLFISRCLQPPASLSAHFLPRFTFNKLSLTCRVLGRPRQSDGRFPSTTCSGRAGRWT